MHNLNLIRPAESHTVSEVDGFGSQLGPRCIKDERARAKVYRLGNINFRRREVKKKPPRSSSLRVSGTHKEWKVCLLKIGTVPLFRSTSWLRSLSVPFSRGIEAFFSHFFRRKNWERRENSNGRERKWTTWTVHSFTFRKGIRQKKECVTRERNFVRVTRQNQNWKKWGRERMGRKAWSKNWNGNEEVGTGTGASILSIC